MSATDFYEDDEDPAEVLAAFDAGEKGVTDWRVKADDELTFSDFTAMEMLGTTLSGPPHRTFVSAGPPGQSCYVSGPIIGVPTYCGQPMRQVGR